MYAPITLGGKEICLKCMLLMKWPHPHFVQHWPIFFTRAHGLISMGQTYAHFNTSWP